MENPTLTIRIPKDLKKAVAEAAKRDDRSVTSFIVKALRDALADCEERQKWLRARMARVERGAREG